MELVFQVTSKFEEDLKEFEKKDQEMIIDIINQNCNVLLHDMNSFYLNVHQPCKLN